MLAFAKHSLATSGDIVKFTPSASSKSAEPDILETLLLPCFAIFKPHAAAKIAAVVEILMVFAPSPPVPTQSATLVVWSGNTVALARIAMAAPAISAGVSPLIFKAVRIAAKRSGATKPLITCSKTSWLCC